MLKRIVSGTVLALLLTGIAVLTSNIQPAKASGTIYIQVDGSVSPQTAPIQQDGDIYTFTDNIYDSIWVMRDNIVIDGAGYTLQGTTSIIQGIRLAGRTNVAVQNTKIKNFQNGIVVSDSASNISIRGNTITNTYNGIWLSSSSDNKIGGNNIANNSYGIRLEYSSSNSISGSTITNDRGIYLYNSSSNSINRNTITNTYYGIWLEAYSNLNNISENNIIANTNSGIVLSGSSNNSISGNNIAENGEGISLTYSSVSGNRIYHNNFMDNLQQVYSLGTGNTWDDGYPSGGNYWSGHEDRYPNATELDNSGIWNTPYVINENNIDHYPLMVPTEPITRKFTAYDNLKVEIHSNSSISAFQFNTTSKKLCFNVTGPLETIGFCNAIIPANLLWGDFSLFINGFQLEEGANYTTTHNGTHHIFHITYAHSKHTIEIIGTEVIPELPTSLILPLFIVTTLFATVFCRKNRNQNRKPSKSRFTAFSERAYAS